MIGQRKDGVNRQVEWPIVVSGGAGGDLGPCQNGGGNRGENKGTSMGAGILIRRSSVTPSATWAETRAGQGPEHRRLPKGL